MSTTPDFQALADALRERLAVIADREWYGRDPEGHLNALRSVSERIAELAERLPRPVDPRLAHYLQRCSYDKALAFLESGPESVPADPHPHA
jgi:hypothetical protein